MSVNPIAAYLSDPDREVLSRQIRTVSNLEEIDEARAALRAWMRQYPDDIGLVDGAGEMLSMLEDCCHIQAAEEATMTPEERVASRERQRLRDISSSPSSLAEVEAAERGLHLWLCEHPSDEEMRGLYPTLAMYREMYEILAEDDAAAEEAARRGAAAPALAAR